MTWILYSISCISCGKHLGIQMTETKSHEYFYCSQCHKRDHIAKGIDLEKVYTERFGILSDNKRRQALI